MESHIKFEFDVSIKQSIDAINNDNLNQYLTATLVEV